MEKDLQITSASITDKGLSEKRPQNEDSFLVMDQCGIYAVADGVGGAQGGEVASQTAMEILSEAFANRSEGVDVEDVLRNAIERANSAIYQMAQDLPKLWNMATTIVALHIADNIATIGHVGDSRLYRVDPEGDLHRETEDHSMVAEEVRAGRMTEEQAENHPSRNIINRALGAEPTIEVDLKTILIEPETSFLICSDGITRHVTDEEIRALLVDDKRSPSDICAHLKTLCYERGAEDNLTAIVVNARSRELEKEIQPTPSSSDEEDTVATARPVPIKTNYEDEGTESNIEQIENTGVEDRTENIDVFPNSGQFLSLDESLYETEDDNTVDGTVGKVLTVVGILVLGGLIGAGLYHFFLVPAPLPQTPQFSEMKSDNIAITSFERLRRTVDSDPAAYLKEIPPARDAEDFYLLGRANLLIGEYSKARTALLESQKKLADVDPLNAKVLATDIAAALVIVNDYEIQTRFKGEIDNASKASNSSSTNSNVGR